MEKQARWALPLYRLGVMGFFFFYHHHHQSSIMIGTTQTLWLTREREKKSMAAMATKRVCLYSSSHFWKIFSFWSELWGGGGQGFQPATKNQAKILNTTRTTHQKSRSTLPRLLLRPTTFYLLNFRVSFQSATVENSRRNKKKNGSPPFFGWLYPTRDAQNSGRELLLLSVAFYGMASTATQPTK